MRVIEYSNGQIRENLSRHQMKAINDDSNYNVKQCKVGTVLHHTLVYCHYYVI